MFVLRRPGFLALNPDWNFLVKSGLVPFSRYSGNTQNRPIV